MSWDRIQRVFLGCTNFTGANRSKSLDALIVFWCDWIACKSCFQLCRPRSSSWFGSFVSLPPWGHWCCVAITCAALYRLLGCWYSTHAGTREQRHGTTAVSRAKSHVLRLQPVPLTLKKVQQNLGKRSCSFPKVGKLYIVYIVDKIVFPWII